MSAETETGSFASLMQRVKAGDEDAARELLDRYGEHVLRVVRRRLQGRTRRHYDSEDFSQSVWASFYAHLPHLGQFECPESLSAFLARLATNKVIEHFRSLARKQNHGAAENRTLDGLTEDEQQRCSAAPDPAPSEVIMAEELRERALADQPEVARQIVDLRLAGATLAEIGQAVGLSEWKVRRILQSMSRKLVS